MVLTELTVNYKKVPTYPKVDTTGLQLRYAIESTKSIELNYNQNTIGLQFAALDFTNPSKNQFKYRLTANDFFGANKADKWANLANENKVQLRNLLPGNYLFEVKGTYHDGIWNETPTTLAITIHPPWWRSNLAYMLYLLSFLGGIYALYKNKIRRVKLQNNSLMNKKKPKD